MNYQVVQMLASLTAAGCMRYPYASGHLIRTAETSTCLAALMGLSTADRERIRLAAPVHDIGKLAIPDDVLLKPGKLDPPERTIIERHSSIGAELLAGGSDELLQFASQIARYHHEHFDGNGYPAGLCGEGIPLAARIVAVADAFDAMTEPRSYRPAMTDDEALSVITRGSGTHFDPRIAQTFQGGIWEILRVREATNRALESGDDMGLVARFYGLRLHAIGRYSEP
ncbi:HD-GYP domain-containing protein [Paraburkholderia caribensis]|uniref:HD-GYP domain-containing protein n=1 Tax=Paraburkholderia caribensis TaxID=75105 RepID=UPI00158FCC45|nr:HD domain-containing phosphohydrolase [Paraburkholderia caribensis]